MVSSTKPTIVLVTGAWHTPICFEGLRSRLTEIGYPSEAPSHPSVGTAPSNKTTFHDDVANVKATLQMLIDQGKEIVVVAHSYGGAVGATAVEGLGKQPGTGGGVIALLFMCAFVVPKGKFLVEMIVDGDPNPSTSINGDNVYSDGELFYNDLPESEAALWKSRLQPQSAACFVTPVPYEPWHDIPCCYLFCENDLSITIEMQKRMVAAMGEVPSLTCAASHSPFLSMPDKVIEAIEMAVKVGMEKAEA